MGTMARGFIFFTAVFLLASLPGVGQIMIPGVGYPGGGYPGSRRYPQGGQGGPTQRQTSDNQATTLVGMLRNIGDKTVVIETDDKTMTTVSISGSTKYSGASGG